MRSLTFLAVAGLVMFACSSPAPEAGTTEGVVFAQGKARGPFKLALEPAVASHIATGVRSIQAWSVTRPADGVVVQSCFTTTCLEHTYTGPITAGVDTFDFEFSVIHVIPPLGLQLNLAGVNSVTATLRNRSIDGSASWFVAWPPPTP